MYTKSFNSTFNAKYTFSRQQITNRRAAVSVLAQQSQEAVKEPEKKQRKPSPLQKGGTLSGSQAAGKDPGTGVIKGAGSVLQVVDGRFVDDRWKNGRWVLDSFKNGKGEVDWDQVIDAEIARREILEKTPIASINQEPVNFDTSEIPWWAWVKRFHLPEAEKINGRAAMVGYFLALVVDQLTHIGIVDQQNSFIGKLLLHVVVIGLLLVRNTADITKFKGLISEATFYDDQWKATWKEQTPKESENQ